MKRNRYRKRRSQNPFIHYLGKLTAGLLISVICYGYICLLAVCGK